jgi:hypothetical protein
MTTKEEFEKAGNVDRVTPILVINSLERLSPDKDGMEVTEGYTFELNGSVPHAADGIAKMALEMDKDPDFGDNGGQFFLSLIARAYEEAQEYDE